ncbi:KpsF/GutQ family sugar-phosphate isomerase [Tetragenococcus halophilus]|uniref:KpsF/GutQ family sugar-phosphate isomerase n=1 Tax=Tetragenococcus halophilus TaxID=51669 RepID=UPI0015B7C4D2|nr:SIS domain-containing protein [Tetragenococcus halophilus]NWN99656.1 SIS domain-containing protein [Tetragenococcus halophilus]
MEMNELKKIINKESNTLKYISDTIDEQQLLLVFELLKNCNGKVITSGCGTSGTAAKKMSHTFNVIGVSSTFLSPADAPHGGVGMADDKDVIILISKGGETEEINKLVDLAKKRSAKIIGITEKSDSYLGKNSDAILQIIVDQESDDFNMLATSSTLAVISVFDAVAILIAREENFSKEQFLKVHPGGEVGDKLRGDAK